MMGNDGVDDVTILVNSSAEKLMGNVSFGNEFSAVSNAVLCAKASMLLQVRAQSKVFSITFMKMKLNLNSKTVDMSVI